jgi:hypothetical protein
MNTFMESFQYTSEIVARAAPGTTSKTLQNWTWKKQWLTPVEEGVSRGQVRRFSRLNVIEAALAIAMMGEGLSREQATQSMRHAGRAARKGTSYADELFSKYFAQLPEIQPRSRGWRWLIFRNSNEGWVIGVRAFRDRNAKKVFDEHRDHPFIHIPVSAIVARVDEVLKAHAETMQ